MMIARVALFVLICSFAAADPLLAKPNDNVIVHAHYMLQYNEGHEQALWLVYEISSDCLKRHVPRRGNFRTDPLVKTGSAPVKAYYKSGYDLGHLMPARDAAFCPVAMRESFYTSNVSPQVPGFNRGVWKKLERRCRKWTKKYDSLVVVTGPIFQEQPSQLGKSAVLIPSGFYKCVVRPTASGWKDSKAIAFIMANAKSKKKLETFAVTVDEVERATGLDFFFELPDEIEDALEAQCQYEEW